MSYGMEVLTTDGFLSVTKIRTAKLFFVKTEVGTSGSFFVPGFDADKGYVFVRSLNGVLEPTFSFDNSNKQLSWSQSRSTADSFLFQFFSIR